MVVLMLGFAAFCVRDGDPVAIENPHYASIEIEHAPAALDNTGWDGMVFRAGETYDFSAWLRLQSGVAVPLTVSLRNDDGDSIAETRRNAEQYLASYGITLSNVTVSVGLIDVLYLGIKLGIYPCLIFMGVGAMTDFSALISNPKLML